MRSRSRRHWSPPDEKPLRIGEVVAAPDGEPVRTTGGLRI